MANEKHLKMLEQGVKQWNQWRESNLETIPDLSHANLSETDLSYANFIGVNFKGANLTNANLIGSSLQFADFSNANLYNANLTNTHLMGARFRHACLCKACLNKTDANQSPDLGAEIGDTHLHPAFFFRDADFTGSNLKETILSNAYLSSVKICSADLSSADLSGCCLNHADLTGSNLSNANLRSTSLLNAKLERADLTGACIEDWNINGETNLTGIECKYIYQCCRSIKLSRPTGFWVFTDVRIKFTDRIPKNLNTTFNPGEFEALVRKQQDTIDLIFIDGIDWQAFFQSFQELRAQYQSEEITIQAIERKSKAFIIRLETTADSEGQKAIEASAKELYEPNKRLIIQNESLLRIVEIMVEVHKVMAESQKIPINQTIIHASGGNIAAINSGSGNIHEVSQAIGANLDEIAKLIQSLKATAQAFPEEQKADIEMAIEDLETDLADEKKREPTRLGKRIRALWLASCAIAVGVAGVTDFSNNLLELSEKLNVPIPIDLIQQSPHFLPGR